MGNFFQTSDSIPDGMGFSHFDMLHITWLLVFLSILILSTVHYHKLDSLRRNRWKKTVAILLVADEIFKIAILLATDQYEAGYLPLHLCSINIFVISLHAWKPSETLGNFLYTVCVPGTMAALLFPSWTKLPLLNAMHIHSFTVHILLAVYPIVLTVNSELKPSFSSVPKSLGLLILMVVPIYFINLLLDTNFMFLMFADKDNPLFWFGEHWGSHLWGFPVITAGVLLVMYGPLQLHRTFRKKAL